MTNANHRRRNCLTLMLAATISGLIWRLAPLHLPFFFFKYGGSCLWAIALYFFIATIAPRTTSARIALYALLASAAVEFSRLIHTPAWDAFLRTLPGRLLIGRFFSPKNIAAYWLAILLTAALDVRTRKN
jgi:hypothetical protein